MIPIAAAVIEAKRRKDAFVPSWDKPPFWDLWFENAWNVLWPTPCDTCLRRARWIWIEWGPDRTATFVKHACDEHRD